MIRVLNVILVVFIVEIKDKIMEAIPSCITGITLMSHCKIAMDLIIIINKYLSVLLCVVQIQIPQDKMFISSQRGWNICCIALCYNSVPLFVLETTVKDLILLHVLILQQVSNLQIT